MPAIIKLLWLNYLAKVLRKTETYNNSTHLLFLYKEFNVEKIDESGLWNFKTKIILKRWNKSYIC